MTKKLLVIIAALLAQISKGQVTISVQLPPAGMIQKDQLWNLVLVNNSSEMLETTVSLNLQDAVTGQNVLSAATRSILLGKGVKMISSKDIQPVQYNYLAAEFSSGFIPLGSYVACYRVSRIGPKGPEPMADECVRLNIGPLSPPLLNTPADKSILQTPYPQFSWLPPTPAEMFSNLRYDIAIAEVLPGQSPAEAVMNNVPVYAKGDIKNPFENYPGSFTSLQPGTLYAWQVKAYNGLNYSDQTEVWTFSVQTADSIKTIPAGITYISAEGNDGNEGVNFIKDKNLFIKYYSFYKDHETIVKIFSPDGKLMQEINQKISYGDNFLLFRLNRTFQENKVYTAEITDPQQTKHLVRFSIKQPNKSN